MELCIESTGIRNGLISEEYGKFGAENKDGMPTWSLPFMISNVPAGTQSFAVILDDKDAIPVMGFDWIHWLIANLTETTVPAGASTASTVDFVQGQNSWGESSYGGMAPPDRPHTYDLTVFALDTMLPLKDGFTEQELRESMRGHILAEGQLSGLYRDK